MKSPEHTQKLKNIPLTTLTETFCRLDIKNFYFKIEENNTPKTNQLIKFFLTTNKKFILYCI